MQQSFLVQIERPPTKIRMGFTHQTITYAEQKAEKQQKSNCVELFFCFLIDNIF